MLCALLLSLSLTACTSEAPGSNAQPSSGPENFIGLEEVLCQVSVGEPDDKLKRQNLRLIIGHGTNDRTRETHIGRHSFLLKFNSDGFGAPSLSFVVRRDGLTWPVLNDHFQLTPLDSGEIELPQDQLGSSFTGVAHIRDPETRTTITRSCRAF